MDLLIDNLPDDGEIYQGVNDFQNKFLDSLNEEDKLEYLDIIQWYQSSSLHNNVLEIGAPIDDFFIHTADNQTKSLSQYLVDGPVVFVFFRSDWCHYCNYYLEVMRKALPLFSKAKAQMFAITPEKEFSRADWYLYNSQGFEVISDTDFTITDIFKMGYPVPENVAKFLQKYGAEPYDSDKEWRLPLTGAFIADTDQTVAWRHVGKDYRYRTTPRQIIDALSTIKRNAV